MQFEGPEKKLEIIFKEQKINLRDYPKTVWQEATAKTFTRIISRASNEWLDAYLLSESSLFVYADRIIMITCGKSQLFRAVPYFFQKLNADTVKYLFYERKNFIYPDEQLSDFDEEIKPIAALFPGNKIQLGDAKNDHILLYFYASPEVDKPINHTDTTLEILMHEIDPQICQKFYASSPQSFNLKSDIQKWIHKESIIYDDYNFRPCGYSVNALAKNSYITLHVTPQPECSYISFETNLPLENYDSLINEAVNAFQPGRFTIVFTHNHHSRQFLMPKIKGFAQTDFSTKNLGNDYAIISKNFTN
ncbi:MAG: hypothetical protein HY602_02670 [Parcubacteria group bacterium]|nr:hypothetical protein [Parcubacteria group bacterium]